MNPLHIEHAKIAVEDLEVAIEFYTRVMGLVEITRKNGVVYLGCGRDGNFDLAIEEGGTGLEHVAFRVGDVDTIDQSAAEFDNAGVDFERRDGTEPGQRYALWFRLPSGIAVELVVVDNPRYPHSDDVAHPERSDSAPLGIDHVNVRTPSLKEDAAFLRDNAGFKISEIVGSEDEWSRVFVRGSETHHDIALGPFGSNSDCTHASLHHLGWEYLGIEQMKQCIDRLAQANIPLERGLGRHYAGDNLYTYFWAPSGNRLELVAEMANVYTDEPNYLPLDVDYSTAWGAVSSDSWDTLCGLAGYDG